MPVLAKAHAVLIKKWMQYQNEMRLDKIAWMKLYTGHSVSGLNIIYLWFNDTDSNSDYIAGVATTLPGHVTCAADASLL